MRLGLIQMDVKLGQPEQNLEAVLTKLASLAQQGCDMVVLPELWDVGFDYINFGSYRALAKHTLEKLRKGAKDNNVCVHGGSILYWEHSHFYNRSYLIDRAGQVVANYDKVHLFGLMDEPDYLAPGKRIVVAEMEQIKFGLAICYDLRFPELFRAQAAQGAKVICVPGQWPGVRREHWTTLLKARAIENQVFVVGVNRVGKTGETSFGGCSLVVDPWGQVLVEGSTGEALLTADINLDEVTKVRSSIGCWQDRRLDLYG